MKCRWYQFLIDRALDDGLPPPEKARRHLQHCAPCRQRFARQEELVRQLARPDPSAKETAPGPWLRARILNNLAGEQPHPAPAGGPGRRLILAGAAAMVLALFAWMPLETNRTAGRAPASSGDAMAVVLLEKSGRVTSGGELLLVVTNFDQPLQRELNLVIDDARSALRSLQADLLPSQLLAKSD